MCLISLVLGLGRGLGFFRLQFLFRSVLVSRFSGRVAGAAPVFCVVVGGRGAILISIGRNLPLFLYLSPHPRPRAAPGFAHIPSLVIPLSGDIRPSRPDHLPRNCPRRHLLAHSCQRLIHDHLWECRFGKDQYGIAVRGTSPWNGMFIFQRRELGGADC